MKLKILLVILNKRCNFLFLFKNKIIFSIFLVFIFTDNVYSQKKLNIINNPSFEENIFCPDKISQLPLLKGWTESNWSTDYFNACFKPIKTSLQSLGIPNNFSGSQEPIEGVAYAGFGSGNESLQNSLLEPLIKDSTYYLEFYLSLGDSSTCSTYNIGAYFSVEKVNLNIWGNKEVISIKPQICNPVGSYLDSKKEWMKVSGYYKAIGGEKYLTISSFKTVNDFYTNIKYEAGCNKCNLYYYIENVSLIRKSIPNGIIYNDGALITCDSLCEFKNLNFATGKSIIKEDSYPELNEIANLMIENKKLIIQLIGHTDETGNAKLNNKLSLDRANAVATYLQQKSIDKNRITCIGLGQTKTIVKNKSKEGNALNRRVEFIVKKGK